MAVPVRGCNPVLNTMAPKSIRPIPAQSIKTRSVRADVTRYFRSRICKAPFSHVVALYRFQAYFRLRLPLAFFFATAFFDVLAAFLDDLRAGLVAVFVAGDLRLLPEKMMSQLSEYCLVAPTRTTLTLDAPNSVISCLMRIQDTGCRGRVKAFRIDPCPL